MRHRLVLTILVAALALCGAASAQSPSPAAAGAPIDPAQLSLQYRGGDWRTTTPDGQWWDPAVAGSWRISRARYDTDGRLRLRVVVRPFAGSLGLDPGPAVLFGTVELVGDAGGDVGALADVQMVARTNVRPCRAGPSCVYRATITLPTDRITAAAARRPGSAIWTNVDVRLTLVRTFSQGAWIQVVPGPYQALRGGTLARPRTGASATEVYGLFTPAQGQRWLDARGPRDSTPEPILSIVEAARVRAGDRSEVTPLVPVRLDIDPTDCSGWTMTTVTGDVAYDEVDRLRGRVRTGVAVPAGTIWYIRAPSLENTSVPEDAVHSFGPFTAPDGPFSLTGSFSCQAATGDVRLEVGADPVAPIELGRCLVGRPCGDTPCAL
jgi:hypothetical protein